MDGWLTEWSLRKALASRDIDLSHPQFQTLVRRGLIPESVDGRWPPDTLERLVEIHRLGHVTRSLARRLLILRDDHMTSMSGTPNMRAAMIEVAPKIKSAKRKMKRVHAAMSVVGARVAGTLQGGPVLRRDWSPPPPREWKKILGAEELYPGYFAERVNMAYFMARSVLPSDARMNPVCDLGQIPFEECIVLLTVHDLAARAAFRRVAVEEEEQRQKEVERLLSREASERLA